MWFKKTEDAQSWALNSRCLTVLIQTLFNKLVEGTVGYGSVSN
jgi:hypothetical protein